ncbi:MAG TPA: class I SAM-dependent methyltransferase [Roseiflexaceae bacterium]|nr:class I SAM-dependent methyltransferase [Roseiflexaceae bacterium]
MLQSEMVDLIRAGIHPADRTWADLGCGTGNFTLALRQLLDPAATIYAFDRDRRAVDTLRERARHDPAAARIVAQQADVLQRFALPNVDGILMANLLHFLRDQRSFLATIAAWIVPGGRLLIVEYDQQTVIPWVPFPVDFARLHTLATDAGLPAPRQIGYRRSPSSGQGMYAALMTFTPSQHDPDAIA